MAVPRNIGQQVAMNMGWTGEDQGEGGHIRWQDSLSPEQAAEYNAAKAGSNVAPALEEPLHEWERSGLSRMSKGADTAEMERILSEFRQKSGDALGRSSEYTATGASDITPEEVETMRNPYSRALKTQLSESAEKVRAQALTGQGIRGGRSFGDTSTGIQMGEIDRGVIQGESEIDYNTWRDAMADITAGRGRNLTAANIETGVGGAYGATGRDAFGMAQDISSTDVSSAQSKVGAGRYVRDFNQNINDVMLANIRAKQQDELTRLQNEQNLLSPYGSSTNTTQTGGDSNWMQNLGYGGQVVAGGIKDYNIANPNDKFSLFG